MSVLMLVRLGEYSGGARATFGVDLGQADAQNGRGDGDRAYSEHGGDGGLQGRL
jgi:hypothetical protein